MVGIKDIVVPGELTFRRAALVAMIPLVLLVLVTLTTTMHGLKRTFIHPLEFRFRHWVDRDPPLDPRLQLFTLDDSTVEMVGDDELSLSDWRALMEAFATKQPRAVLVDHVFNTIHDQEDAPGFVEALRKLPFPVISGAIVHPHRILDRPAMPLSRPDFDLRTWLRAPGEIERLYGIPMRTGVTYGPRPPIRDAFAHIGHVMYDDDDMLRPFVRLSRTEVVPAAPLFIARERQFRDGALYLDNVPVLRDWQGRVLVNLPHPRALRRRSVSLTPLLRRVRAGTAQPVLSADSVVMILSAIATGYGEQVDTPFGQLPKGYVLAGMVNSVLSGRWLRVYNAPVLALLLGALLGLLMGWRLGGRLFWLGLFVVPLAIAGGGLVSFAFFDSELPWTPCLLGVATVAVVVFAERSRGLEASRRLIIGSLGGSLDRSRIEALARHPEALQRDATGRVITVMFIDIVGFSLAAERQTPKQAFLRLRETIADVTSAVHRFGGVVDKTIGDGVLCFFGYQYDAREARTDHADQAMRCAIAIQRRQLQRAAAEASETHPVFPLRIGINTAAVYIGDLGGGGRIDMTVIGHGVNIAKRMESACDPYRIMAGTSTRDMLVDADSLGAPLIRRYVRIKHSSDLIEAFECDPFPTAREQVSAAMTGYRGLVGGQRLENRWSVPAERAIHVVSELGGGKLLNFSNGGLGVQIEKYAGVGVTVHLELDQRDGDLRDRLRAKNLLPLFVEVRWGRFEAGAGIVGLVVKNLSREQCAALVVELRKAIQDERAAA